MNSNLNISPSFGRMYTAATTKAARTALSRCVDIVKEQKNVLNQLDQKGFDIFLQTNNQTLDVIDDSKKVFKIEIRKKLMPPFVDESTDFLELRNGENAVGAFVWNNAIKKEIKCFFSKVNDAIKDMPDFD